MYEKLLRKIVAFTRRMAGHCGGGHCSSDGDDKKGGVGHCS